MKVFHEAHMTFSFPSTGRSVVYVLIGMGATSHGRAQGKKLSLVEYSVLRFPLRPSLSLVLHDIGRVPRVDMVVLSSRVDHRPDSLFYCHLLGQHLLDKILTSRMGASARAILGFQV